MPMGWGFGLLACFSVVLCCTPTCTKEEDDQQQRPLLGSESQPRQSYVAPQYQPSQSYVAPQPSQSYQKPQPSQSYYTPVVSEQLRRQQPQLHAPVTSQPRPRPAPRPQPEPTLPLPPPPKPPKPWLLTQSQLGAAPQQEQPRPVWTHQPVSPSPLPQAQVQSSPQQQTRPAPSHQSVSQRNQLDSSYVSLRERADLEYKLKKECIVRRRQARGDRRRTRELSQQCEVHQNYADALNKQASDWIFSENNKNRPADEIDLHGLYVQEAIARTDDALAKAKNRNASELRLIVGKGLHSTGEAKVKPAIEKHVERRGMAVGLDPSNAGVLIVRLRSTSNHKSSQNRTKDRRRQGKKAKIPT